MYGLNVSKEEFVIGFIKNHNVPLFKRCYEYAKVCHQNHTRQDGSYYFGHPNEVCYVLLLNNIQDEIILSDAICHDIVEELRDKENIILSSAEMMKEVRNKIVVEDTFFLTKPAKNPFSGDDLRAYFNGIEGDIRRIVVKTADRYCNMRRSMFGNFDKERLKKYDRETVHFILPISQRVINSGRHSEYENILRMLRSGIKGFLEGIRAQLIIMDKT